MSCLPREFNQMQDAVFCFEVKMSVLFYIFHNHLQEENECKINEAMFF